MIKVSRPGPDAVPTSGRRIVDINLVSFGCHANLLQAFIRAIGKDAGLIFDEGKKKKKKRSFAVSRKFSLTGADTLRVMDEEHVELSISINI